MKYPFGQFRSAVPAVSPPNFLCAPAYLLGGRVRKRKGLDNVKADRGGYSWLTREIPVDWKLENMMLIYKKGKKEDPGNYRPVSLTLVPGKVMEQIILSVIMWHVQDNQVTIPSQHGFMKGRSCLTNLISYDKVIQLVDEGKAVDVV
ncbi:mitochondrial enolase superfamily member 1 [Grus japonensis]|uniref:Mitochondrial enolase superfamily member 1 n=1 Tax=Grus japonensis TaxID=30415 RepID=A0ABC9YC49_GRUJA